MTRTSVTDRYSDRDKEKLQDNCCRVQFIKVLKARTHIRTLSCLTNTEEKERNRDAGKMEVLTSSLTVIYFSY